MAEVAERRAQNGRLFLLLVPAGKRQIRVDFPRWITNLSESETPDELQEFAFLIDDHTPQPISSRELTRAFAASLNGDSISLELETLVQFCRDYPRIETASLLAGISAAVLLAAAPIDLRPDTKINAQDQEHVLSALLRNLGYRALRSFHLELLTRCWRERRKRALTDESEGVTARIDALLSAVRENASIDVCWNSVDRLFDHLALIRGTDYETALVNALAVGLGRSADLRTLLHSCENVAETVRAVRLVMLLRRPPNSACKAAAGILRRVGERMLANRVDIPLNAALR